jgi:hypothetical protein
LPHPQVASESGGAAGAKQLGNLGNLEENPAVLRIFDHHESPGCQVTKPGDLHDADVETINAELNGAADDWGDQCD